MSELARRRAAWSVVTVAAVGAGALLVWAVPPALEFAEHAPATFWSIALMALLVDLPVFTLARRVAEPTRTTLSVCFTFAIFLLWGAAPAIVVQAMAGVAAGLGRSPMRAVYLVARLVIALAAAEVAVQLTTGRPLAAEGTGLTGHDLAGFLLPAATWFAANFGLLLLARAVRFGGTVRSLAGGLREDVLATAASMLLISSVLTTMSGWWTVLVAVPVFAWNQLSREFTGREQRSRREPGTGLLNRRGLMLGAETLVARDVLDPRSNRPFGVALVNVESVLGVNKLLGRDLYEELVTAAGRRLAATFGGDRVGRLSGESFVLLVPGLTAEEALVHANAILTVLTPVFEIEGIPFSIDPAVGVSLAPQHGTEFNTLVSKAELAMVEARKQGRTTMVYVRQAREVADRRIALLQAVRATLRSAERRQDVAVFYQPQVDLRTGRLAGAEALVRWTHPIWGPVAPDEMIEAVEPTEVMHLLTRHMLDRVCAQISAWNERGLRVRVAVNASVQDLHDPDFPAQILAVLRAYGVPPGQLTIEITERLVLDDAERMARAARRIAELGVGLSLDDFGTGFASIQQLRILPLTEVKIDKSYVNGMTGNEVQRAIVTSVHQLASALNLAVVAEGVEDARTAAALTRLPGTIGQGWHFGHPVPADEFVAQWHHLGPPAAAGHRPRR